MSLLHVFQYPHIMDSLFTFLTSFNSMWFFSLSWLRSEGSQCHMQWIPNLSSGFLAHLLQGSTGIPLLLSFCCWVCITFIFFFFTVILIISSIITYVNILRVLNVVQNTKPASLNPQNQMGSAGFWRGCALLKAAEWGVLGFCCHNPQVAPAQVLVRRVSPVSPEEWSKWSCHSPPSSAALAFITWTCSWLLQTRLYWAPPQNNILGELFLLSHFEETPREWGPLSEGIPKLVLKVLIKENKEWN